MLISSVGRSSLKRTTYCAPAYNHNMQVLRTCSSYVVLLVSMLLAQPAAAIRDDDEYKVHWVEKRVVVARQVRHVKRKEVCQPEGWSLCPASVGGGCCPDNFECGTSSCFATTAGPTSCHGTAGWYNCPLTAGPGTCCPVGLICGDDGGCVPPPGVSASQSCATGLFACPFSLGGGCCPDGNVCGPGVCWDQTPRTFPVSETITTTDSRGSETVVVMTSTTVITEGPDPSSGSPTNSEIAQLIPSTVEKIDAIQTGDSGGGGGGGGGLSPGALGGIAAAAVVILIVVVAAATFVFLRFRRAEKALKATEKTSEPKHDPSNSQSRSHKSGFGQPTISDMGSATDVDPLNLIPIMQPSPRLRSRSATDASDPSLSQTPNLANSDTSSAPFWGVPFGYAPSIPSDGRQSSQSSHPQQDSRPVRMSQTVSIDSQGPFAHSRQSSDVSELEEQRGMSELSAVDSRGAEGRRRSSSIKQGQNRARGNSNAGPGALVTVNERFELHGHYGPAHTAVGQTLDRGASPFSSVSSQRGT
ncbi:hypothetical protein F4777DRAFT_481260 [Nemania sp. FL0916]|nr:hypothetical protein F4777DRAFT_481260 [Nemania sp. FL0916]